MITLKTEKAICPVRDKQSVSPVSGKLTNLRLFLVENKDWTKAEIGYIFFFKEKRNLKHLKIIRSSEPTAHL